MKLIDADAINFEDMCDCCPSADCGDCPGPKGFASWLKKQSTAYDLDKIVEQLEKEATKYHNTALMECLENGHTFTFENADGKECGVLKAIEIVKSGGSEC